MRLEVWAPHAGRVELVLGEKRAPMIPGDRGWWRGELELEGERDYAFSLDGGPPRPDPRSPWQPGGVDGPSRTVDHVSFGWTDRAWRPPPLEDWVIYELHVGTFTPEGTFAAVSSRLDHLRSLGVSAIELMPVAEFPGDRNWGYDCVDLYAPHHGYGGPQGLKELVKACHEAGIAVVLDVVYNHRGPEGSHLHEFGPYFTDHYPTPWGKAVNFDDSHSDEVRAFFIGNALMWLADYHVDALRVDAVHAIRDRSATHFLEELAMAVRSFESSSGRRCYVIAESDLNDPRLVTDVERGGYGLDAQWSDDLHHALHALITSERNGYYQDFGSIADVAKAQRQAFVYDGEYSSYRGRKHGRRPTLFPAHPLPGHRFLGYLQNHDQTGNRALGERIGALCSEELVKIASALVFTSAFVPLVFMGEEWGAATPFLYFTSHTDPLLGRAVKEGRRSEAAAFGWSPHDVPDPQDPETFERSKLDWDEPGEERHAEMLRWYRALARLRREHDALKSGDLGAIETRYDEDAGWLVLERGPITVACNFSGAAVDMPLAGELLMSSGEVSGSRLGGRSLAICAREYPRAR
ncbi:MAG: malto-oligosyltrehalose trehalohydrolase [Actinomycetota bacterium]